MGDPRELFVESLADLLADWHLPRATGRVYAFLLLTEEPTTLDELTDATGLSKGQVSTSVRELTSWGLAHSATTGGNRRLYIEAQSGLETLLEASQRRTRQFVSTLHAGGNLVPSGTAASARLDDLVALFDGFLTAGDQILAARESASRSHRDPGAGRPAGSSEQSDRMSSSP